MKKGLLEPDGLYFEEQAGFFENKVGPVIRSPLKAGANAATQKIARFTQEFTHSNQTALTGNRSVGFFAKEFNHFLNQ